MIYRSSHHSDKSRRSTVWRGDARYRDVSAFDHFNLHANNPVSKKTDRERRLRLFDRGNTLCPTCLSSFTRRQAAAGKKVTLEHAPPKALGGKIVCLTCVDCNNRASRIDRLAKIDQKAKEDHVAGRGTRVEVDFFGAGIVSGYMRPKDNEIATRLAKQPVPTSINQLKGGTMKLPPLPVSPDLDVKKGIRFRIRTPNPHMVAVSWLRSAYLLVFSLLGREGNRYAESPSLVEIREQIMNPDLIRVGNRLNGELDGPEFPVDPVVMFCHGHRPPFWVVKMGTRAVFLPCAGPLERFTELTRKSIELSMEPDRIACWAPRQFRSDLVLTIPMKKEAPNEDIDLIGGRLAIETSQGEVWDWIVVDDRGEELVALPLRLKEAENDDGLGLMMMLGEDEYLGRKDRSEFSAATPKKLLSLTVERDESPED